MSKATIQQRQMEIMERIQQSNEAYKQWCEQLEIHQQLTIYIYQQPPPYAYTALLAALAITPLLAPPTAVLPPTTTLFIAAAPLTAAFPLQTL